MCKGLVLLAEGVEEMEVVTPVDIWRRGGIEITLASILREVQVLGRNKIQLVADTSLEDLDSEDFEFLFVPGGAGAVQRLLSHHPALDLVKALYKNHKTIVSICAGPLVLAKTGILKFSTITSHPTVESDLADHIGSFRQDNVVVSNRIITSRGAGTSAELAFKVLEIFKSPEIASQVKKAMVFDN